MSVLRSLDILKNAPAVWKGDEEEKLRAAQEVARATTGRVAGHVMLSYNQASCTNEVEKMEKILERENVRTWIDYNNMEDGSLYKNMSKAVEGAAIVVIFVHNKYKTSENCQYEGEYSAKLKKRILYAHCDPGYKADGWLGLLMGNSLYYNLAGNFEAESALLLKHIKQILQEGQSIDNVQKEAKLRGQAGAGASGGAVGGSHGRTGAQATGTAACSTWDAKKVQDWLTTNEIDFLCKPFAFPHILLAFLYL